jgi:glycosyltransferase involved in cell wall biosynthesis
MTFAAAITELTSKSDNLRRQLIDVTIATLNSAPTIEKSVKSILANVPVRSLLVVDGASSDRTLDILKRYQVKLIEEKALLGWTRYLQARNCETEWIAYFDSDVYAYDSWWKSVSPYAHHADVGMILGFADASINELPIYDAYLKHRARNEGAVAFTNTLIRRRLVLECRDELKGAHAGEDDIVAKHVRASGFKIITIPKSLCYHDRDPFKTHPQVYYRSGRSARMKYGLRGITVVPSALLNTTSEWCRFSRETGNYSFRLLIFLVRLWFNYTFGFLTRPRQFS